MAPPLDFEFDQLEESCEDQEQIRNILEIFLQPDSQMMLATAGNSIAASLLRRTRITTDIDRLGKLCIDVSKQIPYDHPSHVKFATLLEWFSKLNTFIVRGFDGYRPPRLSACFVNINLCLTTELDVSKLVSSDVPDEWLNLHAFAANLYQRRLYTVASSHAVRIQMQALELEEEDNTPYEIVTMAAAQWIIRCGGSLYAMITCTDPFLDQYRYFIPGTSNYDEIQDDMAITIERWKMWKSGYKDIAESVNLSKYGAECKTVARKALAMMKAIEAASAH